MMSVAMTACCLPLKLLYTHCFSKPLLCSCFVAYTRFSKPLLCSCFVPVLFSLTTVFVVVVDIAADIGKLVVSFVGIGYTAGLFDTQSGTVDTIFDTGLPGVS